MFKEPSFVEGFQTRCCGLRMRVLAYQQLPLRNVYILALLGSLFNKGHTVLGCILGPPVFGNLHIL